MIAPPEPNLNYVEIPGRSGGPLDMTGIPFNKLTYKRIMGSWTFLREPDNRRTRIELYEELLAYFTGKTGIVKLEEDVYHFYKGRFSVSAPTTGQGPIKFVITYDLEPRRYLSYGGTVDPNYASEVLPQAAGVGGGV
jgi:hypothetical protein